MRRHGAEVDRWVMLDGSASALLKEAGAADEQRPVGADARCSAISRINSANDSDNEIETLNGASGRHKQRDLPGLNDSASRARLRGDGFLHLQNTSRGITKNA